MSDREEERTKAAAAIRAEADLWLSLQGQVQAIEALLTHTMIRFALTRPHPPIEIARLMQPIEEMATTFQADPDTPAALIEGARESLQRMGQQIEEAMHIEALSRAAPHSPN